ncbi:MAG: hypothetical protein ACFFCP_09260 [Promethearchaeota archaeon]
MTCYFRHLKQTFAELGIDVTPDNKKDIDKAIHGLVGVEYKNCSAAWKAIKKRIEEDRSGFMTALDGAIGKL